MHLQLSATFPNYFTLPPDSLALGEEFQSTRSDDGQNSGSCGEASDAVSAPANSGGLNLRSGRVTREPKRTSEGHGTMITIPKL